MTEQDVNQPKPRKRRWRYVRIAGWLLAIGWFAWFAYVRITTPPAIEARPWAVVAAAAEADAERILEGIAELLPEQDSSGDALTTNRLSGLERGLLAVMYDIDDRPSDVAHRQSAIDYISRPDTQIALDQIVNLLQHPIVPVRCYLRKTTTGPVAGYTNVLMRKARVACAALACHAHYTLEMEDNVSHACRDLRAGLRLYFLLTLDETNGLGDYYDPLRDAYYEQLIRTSLHSDCPREDARALIDVLSREMSLLVSGSLLRESQSDRELDEMLAWHNTRDEDGDGWLVLNSFSDVFIYTSAGTLSPPARFWNISAPLFRSRAYMQSELDQTRWRYRALEDMPLQEAKYYAESGQLCLLPNPDILRGPYGQRVNGPTNQWRLDLYFEHVARRRTYVIMLALSAYKCNHGQYPETLTALVPEYVDRIFNDPITNAPFQYHILPDGKYELTAEHDHPWLWATTQSVSASVLPSILETRATAPAKETGD